MQLQTSFLANVCSLHAFPLLIRCSRRASGESTPVPLADILDQPIFKQQSLGCQNAKQGRGPLKLYRTKTYCNDRLHSVPTAECVGYDCEHQNIQKFPAPACIGKCTCRLYFLGCFPVRRKALHGHGHVETRPTSRILFFCQTCQMHWLSVHVG
jgi:hypothetical protein